MNLRKSLLSSIAAVGIMFGMTGGMASAIDVDSGSGSAQLNVSCPSVTNVTTTFGAPFTINLTSGSAAYNSSNSTVAIEVDLTCNNELIWGVTTSITDFNRTPATVPAGKTNTFPGSTFKMTGGSLTGWIPGPTASLSDDGPEVNAVVVPNTGIPGSVAMADAFFFDFPSTSSPGVSTATWNTQLVGVPNNIWTGTYSANFTVTLYTP